MVNPMNAALEVTQDEEERMLKLLSAAQESEPGPVNDPVEKLRECLTIAGMQAIVNNGNLLPASLMCHLAECSNCAHAFRRAREQKALH